MNTRSITNFDAESVRNNNFFFTLFAPTALLGMAYGVYLILGRFIPVSGSVPLTFIALMVGAAASAVALVGWNYRRVERNRMAFSQQARQAVSMQLYGQLRLEDVETLRRGRTVQLNGYSVWLERRGGQVHLMTDKQAGTGYYTLPNRRY